MKNKAPHSPPPLLRKTDFLIIGLLLAAVLTVWLAFPLKQGATAVVRIDGQVQATLPLAEPCVRSFEHNGYHLTLAVENRQVSVRQSDCPDGLCMAAGALSRAGETAVCLPARWSVTVESHQPAPDGITF